MKTYEKQAAEQHTGIDKMRRYHAPPSGSAVEPHDREEPMSDGLTAELFEYTANGEQLVRSTKRLSEQAQIFDPETPA